MGDEHELCKRKNEYGCCLIEQITPLDLIKWPQRDTIGPQSALVSAASVVGFFGHFGDQQTNI